MTSAHFSLAILVLRTSLLYLDAHSATLTPGYAGGVSQSSRKPLGSFFGNLITHVVLARRRLPLVLLRQFSTASCKTVLRTSANAEAPTFNPHRQCAKR